MVDALFHPETGWITSKISCTPKDLIHENQGFLTSSTTNLSKLLLNLLSHGLSSQWKEEEQLDSEEASQTSDDPPPQTLTLIYSHLLEFTLT